MPPLKAWLSMLVNVKLPFLLLFQPTPPTSAQETCCFLFPLLSNAWEHGGLPVYRALNGLKKTSRRRDAPSLQEAAESSTVLSTPFPPSVSSNTVVLPCLLFGAETWILNPTLLQKLESFQAELAKRILWLPTFTPNNTALMVLQWPSMRARILIIKLCFLHKVVNS